MLTADDERLAAREQALPGLALLLDEDAFAAALRERLPDAGVGGAEEFYARYKPGHSCVVAYRVRVGDEELDVYARAMRRESFDRIEDMSARAPVRGSLGPGGLLLADVAISIYAFPNDRRIETMRLLGGAATRLKLLSEVLPARPHLWEAAASRLRYWPERRFVARLQGENGESAALKLYAERSYGSAGNNAVGFQSRGPLRLPACVGRSDSRRVLAFEWLPGQRLDGLLIKDGFDASLLAHVGAALAELHSQDPAGLPKQNRAARSGFLRARAAWVAIVRPELAERVGALASKLEDELTRGHGAEASLHGDFSPAQVLVDGDAVSIIDFDDAVRGDPAEDLGVFISRLELRTLGGKFRAERREQLVTALLEGYEAHAGPDTVDRLRVRRHVAAELVRRLPGAFRRRAPDWIALMTATLARAEEISREKPASFEH
jgi:Ser/Thr protein kinase RdoA (MazF antagonist)